MGAGLAEDTGGGTGYRAGGTGGWAAAPALGRYWVRGAGRGGSVQSSRLTSGGASAPRSPCRRGPPRPPRPGREEWGRREGGGAHGGASAGQHSRPSRRGSARRRRGPLVFTPFASPAPAAAAAAARSAAPPPAAAAPHLRGAQGLLDGQPRAADVHHQAPPELGVRHQRVARVVHLSGFSKQGGRCRGVGVGSQ